MTARAKIMRHVATIDDTRQQPIYPFKFDGGGSTHHNKRVAVDLACDIFDGEYFHIEGMLFPRVRINDTVYFVSAYTDPQQAMLVSTVVDKKYRDARLPMNILPEFDRIQPAILVRVFREERSAKVYVFKDLQILAPHLGEGVGIKNLAVSWDIIEKKCDLPIHLEDLW